MAPARLRPQPGDSGGILGAGKLAGGLCPEVEARLVAQVVVSPGHVHQGRNLGTQPGEILVSYFNVPPLQRAARPRQATTPAERARPPDL